MDYENLQKLAAENMQAVKDFMERYDKRAEAFEKRLDTIQTKAARPGSVDQTNGALNPEDRYLLAPNQRVADSIKADLPDGIKASDLSLSRMLKGITTGDWKQAEAEQRVMTFKALGGSSDTAGGYLLNEYVSANLIDLARARSTFIQAGGRTLPISGQTALPVLTGDPTGQWKAENAVGTFSDVTFGRFTLRPKALMFLVKCSIELLEDSAGSIDGILGGIIGECIGTEIDRVAYRGTGAANEPKGIWYTDGVNTVVGDADLTDRYSAFLDGAQAIYEANYSGEYSGLSVVMPPRTRAYLAKSLSGDGQPLQAPPEYVAMRKFQTTQMTTTEGAGSNESMIVQGDFTQAVLAIRTGLTLEATRQAGDAFRDLQVWFRGYARVDTAVLRPAWFAKLTGVQV